MEKEFVPYDLALELKDLGFGEECFAWYNMSQDNLCFFGNDCCADMYAGEKSRPEAPLWQQAYDWLFNNFSYICIIENNMSYEQKQEKLKDAIRHIQDNKPK